MWWKKSRFSSVPILRHLSLLKTCNHDINDTYQLLIHIKLWYTSNKASSHWNYSYNLKLYSICGRKKIHDILPPKDVLVLIPRFCEYFTLNGKGNFADVIKWKILRWQDYPRLSRWAQCVFTGGRLRGQSQRAQIWQQMQKVN